MTEQSTTDVAKIDDDVTETRAGGTKIATGKQRKKRVCLPRGLTLSHARDLPLLRLIRNSTFISRPQIHGLAQYSVIAEDPKNLNRRLRKLAKGELIVEGKPAVPFPGTVYSVSHKGLLALENNGEHLGSISSKSDVLAVPNQTIHYLMLNQIRMKWHEPQNIPLPEGWQTDRIVKASGSRERKYAKDYDGIVELPAYCGDLGIEYERYLKSVESYTRIADALDKEQHVGAVLYFTNSPENSLELVQRIRTNSFPVAALAVSDFLHCSTSVYLVKVYCQASTDGPIWQCNLGTFLLYYDEVHRLHRDKNLWEELVVPGTFKDHRR